MCNKCDIISAEFLFVLLHNINLRKLIGEGGRTREMSHAAPNVFAPALDTAGAFRAVSVYIFVDLTDVT
jgi:hypothetical protein